MCEAMVNDWTVSVMSAGKITSCLQRLGCSPTGNASYNSLDELKHEIHNEITFFVADTGLNFGSVLDLMKKEKVNARAHIIILMMMAGILSHVDFSKETLTDEQISALTSLAKGLNHT